MESSMKADRQGRVEDVNILAVWDGFLGHAVEVNICVKVNSRPGTRQVLMYRSDELVEDASITNIRELKPLNADNGIPCDPPKCDQPSGPSPSSRIPVTQQPFENWNLKTPEKNQLATFYRDITSSRGFSAAAAAERWQEIKETESSQSSVSCYPNTDDGYAQLDKINSQHDQPTAVNPLASVSTTQVNTAPSSMASSLKSSSASDCSSNVGFKMRRRRSRVPQATWRRSRYASELFTYDGMEDLRTRITKGLPLPVWNTSPKTMQVGKASPNAPIKKSWIPPALNDLSSQNKTTSSPGSGTKPSRPLKTLEAYGTGTKKNPQTSGLGKHINCRQSPHNVTEPAGGDPGIRYNEIKSNNDSHAENENSCAALANLNIFQRPSKPPKTPVEVCTRDLTEADYRRYSFESVSTSPSVSPRAWLRHRGASVQHLPPTRLENTQMPTWVIEDGKLCIIFPEDSRPGTFEIDIRAKIRLSFPISPYRHSFSIPGLLKNHGTQEPIPTGSFAFFVEREKWIPHACEVRLAPGNLSDWRIKESSHAIGSFRLDTSPKLSIRIKAPVFHVLDFSAAVQISTTIVPMTERDVGLHHRVKVISEISHTDVFADRVDLFVIVRSGLLGCVEYRTEIGTCTVLHESVLGSTGKKENEALLKISRDLKDLRADIDLNFTVPYRVGSGTTPYPTVRPLFGNKVSETIVITCPKLPLILEHVPQVQLSSWEALHYNESEHAIIRLDRVQMPKCFPEGLRDDPLIHISELSRVSFRSLESADDAMVTQHSVCVARDLHFTLHETANGEITCCIDVDVEVGQDDRILVIDPQGWHPCYSLIGGQLATEQCGQWRDTEDKYLTLFKADSMIQGRIVHVVFQFQRQTRPDSSEDMGGDALSSGFTLDGAKYVLPKIIGKTSLGAVIKSDLEQCTVHVVDRPGHKEISQTLSRIGVAEIHLPRLTPSYQLSIGFTKPSGVAVLPNPVILSSKRRKRGSSSLGFGSSPSGFGSPSLQPDHHDRNRVRFAETKTTSESLATETSETSDDTKVAETGISCVANSALNEATTDAPSNAATMEEALTATEEEIPDRFGYLSRAFIVAVAFVMYLACIHLETGLSTWAPFGSDSAGMEIDTGLTSSLCGAAECNEGGLGGTKSIPGDSYGEPMDAPSEPNADSKSVNQNPLRRGEASVLDMIDRALGWKGR
ncbi:hypothetical protein MMC30_007352 [Trapelia coarctata]|nr:hypothetical protein [Trapelia coarctata]